MANEGSLMPTSLVGNNNTKFSLNENPVEMVVTESTRKLRDALFESIDRWNLGTGGILSVNVNNERQQNDSPTSVDSGFNSSSPASNKGDGVMDLSRIVPAALPTAEMPPTDLPLPVTATASQNNNYYTKESIPQELKSNFLDSIAPTTATQVPTIVSVPANGFTQLPASVVSTPSTIAPTYEPVLEAGEKIARANTVEGEIMLLEGKSVAGIPNNTPTIAPRPSLFFAHLPTSISRTSSKITPTYESVLEAGDKIRRQNDLHRALMLQVAKNVAAKNAVVTRTQECTISPAIAPELPLPAVVTSQYNSMEETIAAPETSSHFSECIEKVVRENTLKRVVKSSDVKFLPLPQTLTSSVTNPIFKEPVSPAITRAEIPKVVKKAEKKPNLQRIVKKFEKHIALLIQKQDDRNLLRVLERREEKIQKLPEQKHPFLKGNPPQLPQCLLTPYRIIYLLLKYYYPLEMIDEIINRRWEARVPYLEKFFKFDGPLKTRSKEWPPSYTISRAERDAKEREEKRKGAQTVEKAVLPSVDTESPKIEVSKEVSNSDVGNKNIVEDGGQEKKQMEPKNVDVGNLVEDKQIGMNEIVEEELKQRTFQDHSSIPTTSEPKKEDAPKTNQKKGKKKKTFIVESESEKSSEGEQDDDSDEDFDIKKAVKEIPPLHQKPKRKSKAARIVFVTEEQIGPGPSEPTAARAIPGPSEPPVTRAVKREAPHPPEDNVPKQRRSTRLRDNPICFKDVSDSEFIQMLKIASEAEKAVQAEAQPEAPEKTVEEEKPVVIEEVKVAEKIEEVVEAPKEEKPVVETPEMKTKVEEVPATAAIVRGGRGRPRKTAPVKPVVPKPPPVVVGRIMFEEAPNPLANPKKVYVDAPPRNAVGLNNFRTEYSRRISDETVDSLLEQVWTPTETKQINIRSHFEAPHIRRAFFNTSCYCYAIATLQMLYRAPQIFSIITSHLHKQPKVDAEGNPIDCLLCSLASSVARRPDMDCPDFASLFKKVWPAATAFEQQCAMEAMQKFFLRLDTEYMKDHPDYFKMRPEKFSPFRTFFEIEYIIHHKCTECSTIETLRDRSIYLTVNAEKRNSGTMQDLLNKMSVPEYVNGLNCSGCNLPNVKVHYTFTKLPEVLLYFIPRIKDGLLIETFVPVQKYLTMKARTGAPQVYELCSFIVHIGETIKTGHYVLYEVNQDEDGFNKFDDEKVAINARLGCSYRMVIAMYRKKEDVAKDAPVDMIFDGRGNIMYADEKHCGPKRF